MMATLFNIPWFTESIKKCSIKYIIQRYLGHYLSGELDLSQLNFELFNGKGSIDCIPLDVDTINEEVSAYVPLKFTEGFVKRIEVSIPWSSLWTESCTVHLEGIRLNFCKLNKFQQHDPTQVSILSKSLMTSSMEIAEEIVNQETDKFEGLEKFAQLINSVIRRFRLSAHNTVVKFILPNKKSGAGQEIELRIGHMKVEEDEISLDSRDVNKEEKNSQNNFSDVVTKRITVEGIEVLINDIVITKLYGKHSVKVQFDGNRIDTEVQLGSYIFAILNSDHLKVLKEFFKLLDDKASFGGMDNFGLREKPLTPKDYRFISEIMHSEDKSKNVMNSSMLSYSSKNWTSASAHEEEDRFMPFNQEANNKDNSDDDSSCVFTCNLKVPGIMLCLVSSDSNVPAFDDMPTIDCLESFIGIHRILDTILPYNHIRVSASNLCFEISVDSLQFSCTNVSMYEYYEKLVPILLVKDKEAGTMQPTVRLKMAKNNIDIILDSTEVKLDLTLIERHHKLFEVFTSSESSKVAKYRPINGDLQDGDINVNIECEKLDIEMLFPIPDLRAERDQYSSLHDEILLVELKDMQLRLDSNDGNLVCSQIDIDLRIDDKRRKVFHSESENKDISLDFSTSNPVHFHENFDSSYLLNAVDSMQDSINFFTASTINHNKTSNPFQVKRKMFGDEGNEQILTPGDRAHLERYLANNKDATKFFIRIHVPYGDVYLEDKPLFELIYNRFVNDLVLWTPYFPKRKDSINRVEPHNLLIESNNIFTSAIADSSATVFYERSISNSSEQRFLETSNLAIRDNAYIKSPPLSSTNQTASFFNCRGMADSYDSMTSDNSYHSILDQSTNPSVVKPTNEFMLELEVENLNLEFCTESGRKNTLFTQNLLLGVVVGPESERSTVLCLCTEKLVYKYGDKFILTGNSYMDLHNCEVNMSMEIKRETDMLKKIKLALQLKQALLLGLDLPVFEELYNFVNLKDDEILGYICPKVVLELHTDIVQSGIFFDNLKERPALLHVEDIYLTSMVIENTSQTILRFFIEEALLCFKRNETCLDAMKNFIAVIDSGIIDINLKISKDGRIELKISNNEINVKVCPDSLATLCQFLQSFATQVSAEPNDSDNESTQNEIYMRKGDFNGSELIKDAMHDLSDESHKEKDSIDDDSFNRACSNCDGVIASNIYESGYFVLEDEPGTGIHLAKEPQGRVIAKNGPVKIVENYFAITNYNVIPEITASTLARYLLEKMSLRVSLYGGKDFDDIPNETDEFDDDDRRSNKLDVISQANMSIRSGKSSLNSHHRDQKVRFQQNSVVWENIDLLSNNNGYLTNNLPADNHFSFKCTGGSKRKNDTCVVLMLNKIKMLFDLFDKDYELAWRFLFFVEEIEILDRVNASKIKKILYEYFSESTPRRKYSNMFSIKLTCKRNFQDMNEECDLKVSLKPLRVNIDQDTLMFLMDFFTAASEILTAKVFTNGNSSGLNSNGDSEGSEASLKKARCDSKTSLDEEIYRTKDDIFMDDDDDDDLISQKSPSVIFTETGSIGRGRRGSTSSNASFDNIFIKSFTFSPNVPIRLDYHGKHIDLKQGALPGLFLGLAQLNQSELHLKKLCNKHGLLGFEKVFKYAWEEWSKDIKRNQLPSILGGVGPMHSFIQLFQGIRDLFWMPIDQYRRDQRIVRGIQRGAYAFSISTAMATLELANRLVYLIQTTAQFAHDVVTPPTPGGNFRGQIAIHNSQPRDFREGITVAYTVMREGLHDTVRGVTNAGMVSDDMSTVIGEVVRQIPSTLVRPFIHVSQATSSVLVGMRNQLTPEARKDDHEKWKNANER